MPSLAALLERWPDGPDPDARWPDGLPAWLAVYRARASDVESALDALQGRGLGPMVLRLSDLPAGPWTLPETDLLIIYQDLLWPAFEPLSGRLAAQLLFPLWQQDRPLALFSCLEKARHRHKGIRPAGIHEDGAAVSRFLLREQTAWLLDEAAYQFVAPEATGQAPAPGELRPARRPPRRPRSLDPDLDPGQRRAQAHLNGPIRVLAPAGSGKTKTLTNRIVHLLNEGVPGDRILALAFNRKAALEMNQRLQARQVSAVTVRTFHALGYQLLRRHLGWRYAGKDEARRRRQLLAQAVRRETALPARRDQDPLAPFLEQLTRVKTELPPLDDLYVELEDERVSFGPIFDAFLRLQHRHRFLSFDDMIYLALRLLLKEDALRRQMQTRFAYLLIDEFQDLNQAQLMLLQLLTLPHNNLFVVGDDDQMIYGWRGAQVRHILDFPEQYPTAAAVVLSTNYRSTEAIVRHSRWLIDHNEVRVPKAITARPDAAPGDLSVRLHDSLWDQAEAVAGWLAQHAGREHDGAGREHDGAGREHDGAGREHDGAGREHDGAGSWRDHAILFRYRAYQYPLALALDKRAIPHTPVDLRAVFQTPVGRDLWAYLAVVLDPAGAPAEAFRRILKRPNKYFTNDFIASVGSWAGLEAALNQGVLPAWAWERLQDFVYQLRGLQEEARRPALAPSALLFRLEREFQLLDYYSGQTTERVRADDETDAILWETIYALAAGFATTHEFFEHVVEALAAESMPADDESENAVVLSTIHQAKGREYPVVIYFNLSADGHSQAPSELEEERRVTYVGVTRARERLLITAERSRPSPFLAELWLDPALRGRTTARLIQERNQIQKRAGSPPRDPAAATRLARLQAEIDRRRQWESHQPGFRRG